MKNSFDSNNTTISIEDISFSAFVTRFEFPYENDSILDNIFSSTTHSHSYAELFICFDSGIIIKTEQSDIYLNPGELLLIPPGTNHVTLPNKSDGISIGFSYYKLNRQCNHNFYKQLKKLFEIDSPQIILRNCGSEIKQLCAVTEFGALSVMRILELLLRIARQKSTAPKVPHAAADTAERDIGRAAMLEKLFSNSFMFNIGAEDAAGKLHISKRQLDRITHTRFGKSYHEVMTEYRLKAACKMLIESTLCAEAVGYAVGYNNKSTFYYAFKKKYGVTPIQFRNISKSTCVDRMCIENE